MSFRLLKIGKVALGAAVLLANHAQADTYAKLSGDTFAYYSDAECTESIETPETGLSGVTVLFADDAEYQALVPYTNELAAAAAVALQNDVTLTADADWRAIDFDLNGKVITLMGWDLQVRKPQGAGRITAGNVLDPQGYSFTGSSNDGGSATYEWLWLGGSGSGANQNFTLPKSRTCYLKTKIHYYSSGISQSVRVKIDGTEIFNEKCSGTKTMGPYARTGYTAGTSYKIEILRSGSGNTQAYKWTTISPTSYLCFDIPEGEEYDPSDITFGGSTPGTSDFGGIGLQIHKAGKGKLVMSTAKGDIGGNGVASAVVEEGVLVNANDTGCGAAGSRIEVMDGAQFDTHGAAGSNSAYYDFTLSGAGPDGLGAVANNTAVADAYDKAFVMRNITLATNVVIGGTQNVSLKNGDWTATTMTMGGHTITYTNTTVYAGNMSYSGTGGIVVAPDAALSFYAHSPAAADCDVTVHGSLNQNCGGFTQVKSLVFETGSTCWLSDSAGSGSIPETVVLEKYVPNTTHGNGGTCTLTTPRVQLGDDSHLETTLDLSRLEGVFDGTNTTFYAGSTVTVDLGGREFQGSVLLMAWAEIPTATFVVDDANYDRLGLMPRPEGLYIFPGKVPSFVKYDVENNCWKFYDEDVNPFSGEWTLGMDYMKALFADDAEFQALAQHADEIAASHVTVFLQDDITLTADADWRALDFNLNGKTIVLKGWDLYVHKPQGEGRITAGNVLNPHGYTFDSGSNNGGSATYEWLWLGSSNSGAHQNFTLPKSRTCYLKTRINKYNSTYSQSVQMKIAGTSIFNESCSGTKTMGPYTRTGYTAGTSYKIDILRSGKGSTQASKWTTISPTSYLYFDIDEGDEYDTSGLTFGGSTPETSDFGGLGLQIRKLGKGTLVMGADNGDIGFAGVTTLCVEEGSVENAVSTGAGPSGANVELLYGAQFDSKAATADGIYSLVIHTAGENEGEDTLTYTNATTYANAVTYVGQGAVAVTQDAVVTFQNAATAADCAVNVFGGLVFDGNGLTTVKSFAFASGATFSSSGTLPTTVVTDTFAPNTTATAQPKVQLGDASHLETTLDLSRLTDTFDDSEEGSLTFQSGSTVTIDIGERTKGLGKPAFLWKDAPDETVKFKPSDAMRRRGASIYRRDDGLYFQIGFTVIIR